MANQELANEALVSLLEKASDDELMALTKIISPESNVCMSPISLQGSICRAGGHGVANFLRGGKGVSYLEVVHDAMDALKLLSTIDDLTKYKGRFWRSDLESISHPPDDPKTQEVYKKHGLRIEPFTPQEIEERIELGSQYAEEGELGVLKKVLSSTYEQLDPEQRKAVDVQILKIARQFESPADPKGLVGTAGLMAVAQMGGFATYTLMSSIISAVSFGTLGFGAYTAASSLLSLAIGPVGWLALGTVAAVKYGKTELNKTIPFVATMAMIRQRVKAG